MEWLMGAYILFRLAGIIVPLVPRRLGYAVAGLLASLMYRFGAGKREMIKRNVRHALGQGADEAQVDRVARRIFRNLLKNYFDLFWLPAQPTEKITKMMNMQGLDNLEEAFARGKGVVVVSVHVGNQEVMTQLRALTDKHVTVVAEHVKNERVFRYLTSLRQNSGVRLVPTDGALMELFRALRRNEAIGLVFDRDVTGSGRSVPFFGSPAKLPDGYALIALRHGATIMPGVLVRQADDTYCAHLAKPMVFEGDAKNDEDVRRVMASVGVVIESYIAQFIDQWVYFHDVWGNDKERVSGVEKSR
jgi:phosphatidylinositol dimannoside acyltransferase